MIPTCSECLCPLSCHAQGCPEDEGPLVESDDEGPDLDDDRIDEDAEVRW